MTFLLGSLRARSQAKMTCIRRRQRKKEKHRRNPKKKVPVEAIGIGSYHQNPQPLIQNHSTPESHKQSKLSLHPRSRKGRKVGGTIDHIMNRDLLRVVLYFIVGHILGIKCMNTYEENILAIWINSFKFASFSLINNEATDWFMAASPTWEKKMKS